MSGGVLPPVPDLIPISALQGRSMGEQRPRRRAPAELIDTAAGSRASGAAPPPPPRSRLARPGQRRRKSDHRREQRRASSVKSVSKQGSRNRSPSPALDKPPRVNPIFVWVRQEDTRIVDVKCEDYDKRNRIVLTKTAHGWKAIPRTENMVPSKPPCGEEPPAHHHHHHHHRRRQHKHKSRRKSVSLQFPENLEQLDNETAACLTEENWMHSENVNIESLLPSHTIEIKRTLSPDKQYSDSVNSDVDDLGHALPMCSAPDKVCDVSPLENLLAVAELEFKQQMESGIWKNESENTIARENTTNSYISTAKRKSESDIIKNMEHISQSNSSEQKKLIDDMKIVECDDYNEDDDGIAMNDILSRLEQSLQSPENEDLLEPSINKNNETSKNKLMNEHKSELKELNKNNIHGNTNKSSNLLELAEPVNNTFSLADSLSSVPECAKDLDTKNVVAEFKDACDGKLAQQSLQILRSTTPDFINIKETTDKPIKSEHDSEITFQNLDFLENVKPEETKIHCPTPIIQSSNLNNTSSYEDTPVHLQEKNEIESDQPEQAPIAKYDQTNLSEVEFKKSINLSNEGKTNILEILSKEVEKIEPIKLQLVTDKVEDVQPLDFSIKSKTTMLTINTDVDIAVDEPTDLSVKKSSEESLERGRRPSSQSSEAIQSPQPSGIPAILHSPDIVSTSSVTPPKTKSNFLESLLANATNKITLNAELTITKQTEPTDIEKRRKSASPTVTCSEEIINKSTSNEEPPAKKFKPDDVNLKRLLNKEENLENVVKTLSTNTPALLELLKDSSRPPDPLTDFKKLLLEIDIPEPLMIPKDRFVNLLKNPREEIFNLMKDKPYKNLKIDDILVVFKDKLFAALEANAKLEKTISESKPNQLLEGRDSFDEKPVSSSSKRKQTDSLKNTTPEMSTKNISASDIDAATEAAFSQMMMFPYQQSQLEAMGWSNNQQDLLQALYGTNPFLPGQISDMHPSLQMMLSNNRIPPLSPLGFPSFSAMNFTNPLEFSMWQEAMMQASILRSKSAFENSMLNQPVREFKSQISPRRHSTSIQAQSNNLKNQPNSTSSRTLTSVQEQQNLLQRLYEQNTLCNQNYHNAYLGQAGFSQKNCSTLTVPQYSPHQQKSQSSRSIHSHAKESINTFDSYREHEKRLQQQMLLERQKVQQKQQQERLHREQRLQERLQKHPLKMITSSANKPFSINSFAVPKSVHHQQELHLTDLPTRQGGYQPMDLSGSQNITTKTTSVSMSDQKTDKSYTSTAVSKGQDDVAEVGSTTASIEEMQDANTHLWHPLFGSDKGYSPWSMQSVGSSE